MDMDVPASLSAEMPRTLRPRWCGVSVGMGKRGGGNLRHPTNIRICTRLLVTATAEHRHNCNRTISFQTPSPHFAPQLTLMLLTVVLLELTRIRCQARRSVIIMSVLETAEETGCACKQILCFGDFVEAEAAVEKVPSFGGEVHSL